MVETNNGKSTKNSIERLSSAVFDNGRRGEPRAGCDCVQCFGYCMIDADEQMRFQFDSSRIAAAVKRED